MSTGRASASTRSPLKLFERVARKGPLGFSQVDNALFQFWHNALAMIHLTIFRQRLPEIDNLSEKAKSKLMSQDLATLECNCENQGTIVIAPAVLNGKVFWNSVLLIPASETGMFQFLQNLAEELSLHSGSNCNVLPGEVDLAHMLPERFLARAIMLSVGSNWLFNAVRLRPEKNDSGLAEKDFVDRVLKTACLSGTTPWPFENSLFLLFSSRPSSVFSHSIHEGINEALLSRIENILDQLGVKDDAELAFDVATSVVAGIYLSRCERLQLLIPNGSGKHGVVEISTTSFEMHEISKKVASCICELFALEGSNVEAAVKSLSDAGSLIREAMVSMVKSARKHYADSAERSVVEAKSRVNMLSVLSGIARAEEQITPEQIRKPVPRELMLFFSDRVKITHVLREKMVRLATIGMVSLGIASRCGEKVSEKGKRQLSRVDDGCRFTVACNLDRCNGGFDEQPTLSFAVKTDGHTIKIKLKNMLIKDLIEDTLEDLRGKIKSNDIDNINSALASSIRRSVSKWQRKGVKMETMVDVCITSGKKTKKEQVVNLRRFCSGLAISLPDSYIKVITDAVEELTGSLFSQAAVAVAKRKAEINRPNGNTTEQNNAANIDGSSFVKYRIDQNYCNRSQCR